MSASSASARPRPPAIWRGSAMRPTSPSSMNPAPSAPSPMCCRSPSAMASSASPRSPPSRCRRCSAIGSRAGASPSAFSAPPSSTNSPISTRPSSVPMTSPRCGCRAAAGRRKSPPPARRSSSSCAQGKRSFVERIDFRTSLGHGTGAGDRARYGVTTKGPSRVFTDLCIMQPDPVTKELTVTSIHPGVTREKIAENTGWAVKFAGQVDETPAPTAAELKVLRDLQARTKRAHGERFMNEVFICDGIRTPIGRYAGALSRVRTDDLAAVALKALLARHPGLDLAADRGGLSRLRQPGRRGQPQCRAHGAAAGGAPGQRARGHSQPPLRLGPGGGG